MEVLSKSKDLRISNDVFKKICRDLKSEINENKKEIEKLNELDYKYSKKVVYPEKLVKVIDEYREKEVVIKETRNLLVAYYGDPSVTIELCLQGLLNCQLMNLLIDNMCYGVNKLIVTLFIEILKEYRIYDVVTLNNYENVEDVEASLEFIDKMYCVGDKNIYTICKHINGIDIEYVPFGIIDIYCEDDDFYELSREIFNYCFENGIEAEVYDDMPVDEAINTLNEYGEKYCSIILTKDAEAVKRFKEEMKSKFVFANENPFRDSVDRIPEFL